MARAKTKGLYCTLWRENNSLIGVRKTPVGIRRVLLVGKIILEAGVFTAYERMTKRSNVLFGLQLHAVKQRLFFYKDQACIL